MCTPAPRFLLATLVLFCAGMARAQPADTTLTGLSPRASFVDARSLALDTSGLLYVVDAGRDVIDVFDADGTLQAEAGGSGTREGDFDDPSDIDPTNGLLLVVADAGNGRIQRFARGFHFLESLPVGRGDDRGGENRGPTYLAREGEVVGTSEGRPVAVVTLPTDEMFAIDANRNVIVRWGRDRRERTVFGGPDDGEDALVRPVSLASDGRVLYVADAGRAAVVVYDLFGGVIRTLAEGRATGVRAVSVHHGRLWVTLPSRVLVYDTSGRLDYVFDVDLGEELVEVAFSGRMLYLLTPSSLYVTPWRRP